MPENFLQGRSSLTDLAAHFRRLPDDQPPPVTPIDLPFTQLSVFARSYETSAPLDGVPLYAIATLGRILDPHEQQDPAVPDPLIHVPLGILVTDHAGYASFDLTVLAAEGVQAEWRRVSAPVGIGGGQVPIALRKLWVLPFADPVLILDALASADVGPGYLSLRLELDQPDLDLRPRAGQAVAMQNPNILDWRLSPASFTIAGAVMIGEDGCETLLPANLATQQVRFRQVSRAGKPLRTQHGVFVGGHVLEYTSEWFGIGHSLGQLMYSLPLAPGEVVKLAVVDWARQDDASRGEDTGLTESLAHSQVRERSLTETVHAVLDEWQRGGSIMGGSAASGGGGMSAGGLMGAGAGLTAAIGGAYSTSSGTRDLSAQTAQNIADAFHQASTALRELRSTVVVQSQQAEQSSATTRVVANYNHSHALTLLYYEVLRHHRVTTRLASVRPALLVDYSGLGSAFTDETEVIAHRGVLEAFLLDRRLVGCFDAVAKLVAFGKDTPPPVDDPGLRRFVLFQLRFVTTNFTSPCVVKGWLRNPDNDPGRQIMLKGPDGISVELADAKRFEDENATLLGQALPPAGGTAWKDFGFLVLHFDSQANANGNNHTGLASIDVTGVDETGVEHQLGHVGPALFEGDTPEANRFLAIPMARPPAPPPTPSARMRLSESERTDVERLMAHLQANAAYYNRAMWLNEDPNVRATRFAGTAVGGVPFLDLVENRAMEVLGEFVAFPATPAGEDSLRIIFDLPAEQPTGAYLEQLVAMPTRGLFAEAKLGHCNASEPLDPSRFWDWQSSPIQFAPPDIADLSTASRARDPQGLGATPFPASVVNIATPQALPDPTGLTAALKAISTPDIFRDQSGLQEVGTLLGKLSDNATQLAGQAMKGESTRDLIDQIRNAPELTPEQKSKLVGEVLTGQAHGAEDQGQGHGQAGQGGGQGGQVGGGIQAGGGTQAGGGQGTGQRSPGSPQTRPDGGTHLPPPPEPTPSPKPQRPTPVPPTQKGLLFLLSFQTPVVSTTAQGTATIDIFPVGRVPVTPQNEDLGYVPGVSFGPPPPGAPEFHYADRPFVGGRAVVLQTKDASGPGHIRIVATYRLLTFRRDEVLDFLIASFDTAATRLDPVAKTFTYDNAVAYKAPAAGTTVMLDVVPHVVPATVTAENSTDVATEFASKVGGSAEIISVEGGVTGKKGQGAKNSGTWTIYYVTGGLDITQKN